MVAGTLSVSIIASDDDTVSRMPARSPAAARRAMPGSDAVAIETPKMPSGRYIRRKA